MRTLVFRTAVTLLVVLFASELAHAIAARVHTGDDAAGACTVLVLGYPTNDDGTPSAIEVERMEAGATALKAHRCGHMIISGGAAHNGHIEADVMAALAGQLGIKPERLLLERQARDTKENIALSLPLLAAGANVFIVSNAPHAQRGRRYLCAAKPADCTRIFVAPTAHTWDRLPQRLVESLHEAISFARDSIG
jgi:uncharacterized SAM-binding protein YcdF (DUF218 family)